ncbi:MAG: hypothetical protein ACJ78Q_15025, partial [Chloroflexia bacterium]
MSKDLVEGGGYRAGGTVIYSALAAQRLGLQAAIVTACAPEDDWLLDPAREAGIWVHRVPSPQSTTFRNSYTAEGGRTQVIEAQAVPIKLEHVPEEWLGAHVVHLGPVAQELPVGLVAAFADSRDPGENPPLLGVTPQGWMRSWGDDGRVRHEARPI